MQFHRRGSLTRETRIESTYTHQSAAIRSNPWYSPTPEYLSRTANLLPLTENLLSLTKYLLSLTKHLLSYIAYD